MADQSEGRLRRYRNASALIAAALVVLSVPAAVIQWHRHAEERRVASSWPRTSAEVTRVSLERERSGSVVAGDTGRIVLVLGYTYEIDGRRHEVAAERSTPRWGETHDPAAVAVLIRSESRVELAYDPTDPSIATAFFDNGALGEALLLSALFVVLALAALIAFLVLQLRLTRVRATPSREGG